MKENRIRIPDRYDAASVLPILFFWANLFRMLSGSSLAYLVLLILSGAVGLWVTLKHADRYGDLLFFYGIYMVSLVLSLLVTGNTDRNDVITSLCLLGMTSLMLFRRWSFRAGAVGCYVSLLAIAFAFMTRTRTHIFSSSNNYVSIMLLLSAAFYYIPLEEEYHRTRLIDLVPAGICFLVSVWASGRGGILAAGILLGLMMVCYLRSVTGKNPRRIVALCLLVLAALVFLLVSNTSVSRWFFSLGKWQRKGANTDDRMEIWGSYLSEAFGSLSYFLFGAPLRDIPVVHLVGDNCHNSFLQLHAFNGIGMFLLYMVMLVWSFGYYIRRKQYIIVSILATLVIRAMTDKFVFGQYGMPVMLFFVLWPRLRMKQPGTDTESPGEPRNTGQEPPGRETVENGNIKIKASEGEEK